MRKKLFQYFASLKLAVISILILSVVLAVGTVVEAKYGMRAAKIMVYGTFWFYGVLGLLFINILFAAFTRYPWKPEKYGFVLTHLGLLILLVGSVVTLQWGIDGMLGVQEKNTNSVVNLPEPRLFITHSKSKHTQAFPLPESGLKSEGDLMTIDLTPKTKLVIKEYLPRVRVTQGYQASPTPGVGKPVMHLELSNDRMQVDQWIAVEHPNKAAQISIGPAQIHFQKLWSEKEEADFLNSNQKSKVDAGPKIAYLLFQTEGKEIRIPIDKPEPEWKPVQNTDYEIRINQYLPHAVVEGKALVSQSNDPINPALQLSIRQRNGDTEKHTVFANFPEFPTLHQRTAPKNPASVKLRMISSVQLDASKPMGELWVAQSADDKTLLYKIFGRDGKINHKGEVKQGEKMPTGWMNLEFEVLDWYPHAVNDWSPNYVEIVQGTSGNFLAAVNIESESRDPSERIPASKKISAWLVNAEGFTKSITVDGEQYLLRFAKSNIQIPFKLYLDQFILGKNPGTDKAASYASDVVVIDGKENFKQHISMNEPLVYDNFTFYQSSYSMIPGQPTSSFFSVNQDPGRWIKYAGSIILVLGIILMFYMNPHYFRILFGAEPVASTKKKDSSQ